MVIYSEGDEVNSSKVDIIIWPRSLKSLFHINGWIMFLSISVWGRIAPEHTKNITASERTSLANIIIINNKLPISGRLLAVCINHSF